jgi:16S rRNA U516 pseudouridylate synthase RsuA-like enzyme
VERLARMSYGPVKLGDLPVGRYRPLTDDEVRAIYRAVKLDEDGEE